MKRILMLAAVLAALTGPALAAPAVLTSGGLTGSCSGTENSAPFTASAANFFSLQSVFFTGAAGTMTLTTSTDGGQTFAPLSVNQKVLSAISATDKPFWAGTAGTDSRLFYVQDATAQYRVECGVTSGSAFYRIDLGSLTTTSSVYTLGRPLNDYVHLRSTINYTDAQAQALYVAKFTPLSTSDVANITTGYRMGVADVTDQYGNKTRINAYIKLSIPISTSRMISRSFRLGERRFIYAQSATVTSITDGNGNALSTAYAQEFLSYDQVTQKQVYTVGQAAPVELPCCGEVSPDPYSNAGVHFWPTLTEAIDGSGIYPGTSAPNLTALGL